MTTPSRPNRLPGLALAYPLSLGVFDKYEDAQRAVDTLSDQGFPVQNVLIVGTELKQLERITGRLTQGRVAVGGLLSGLWLGLFVGLVFSLFESDVQPLAEMQGGKEGGKVAAQGPATDDAAELHGLLLAR